MATIRPNENAPDSPVKYLLGSVEFDLSPGGEYETDDRTAISDASVHPWLDVELPVSEELSVERTSKSVPYADDVLAAVNSQAFDPDKVHEMLMNRQRENDARVAIEAGLDQGESVEEGGVAVTLAAAEEATEEAEKTNEDAAADKSAKKTAAKKTADKENK